MPENTEKTEAGTIVKLPEKWTTSTPSLVSTQTGKEVEESKKVASVYAVSTGEGETIPVPIGFFYVGGRINEGVVISDNEEDRYGYNPETKSENDTNLDKTTHEYATKLKGNQFVWIPCKLEEYKKIDWGKEGTKWDMSTSEAERVQVEKYEGFYIGRYEAGVATYNEETNSFENSVTFSNNASLEGIVGIQTGIISGWGWQNYDYTARQEGTIVTTGSNKVAGNVVSKANSIPYFHADYYTAEEMTRRMYENNKSVRSGLITGTQWDMMMKFMQENGIDVLTSNWGNYDDVALTNLRGYYTTVDASSSISVRGKTNGFKSTSEIAGTNAGLNTWVLLTTGSTEQVKKQNLYDVAGNLWEWTMEASYLDNLDYNNNANYNSYTLRGGSYDDAHASYPTVCRGRAHAPSTRTRHGFRATLYIK